MSGNRGQGGIAIYDVTNLLKPKVLKQNYLKFPVHNTFACQMGSKAYMLVVDDVNARDVHIIDISKPQSPREIAVTGAPDWPAAVDNIYPATEGTFTEPSYSLPGGAFAGPIVWTGGQGCTAGEIPPAPAADAVALIQRGTCFFQDKAESAEAQGYAGFVVANDAARGDGLVSMSARDNGPYPPITGYFVGFSTGEVMKAAGVGSLGAMLDVHGVFDGWGYMRVLDTSDPTNPVEIGQYATEGVLAQPPPPGNHTMHNVIVDGTTAYISWYADGMRVVDFSTPTAPVETAHFVDTTSLDSDGAAIGSDFWGVYFYQHPDGNWYILGSDRNTGLWIFAKP